jgi:hypothetical protein
MIYEIVQMVAMCPCWHTLREYYYITCRNSLFGTEPSIWYFTGQTHDLWCDFAYKDRAKLFDTEEEAKKVIDSFKSRGGTEDRVVHTVTI